MCKQKPQNGFLSITLVISLRPKLFMHEGDILVLFIDLCLRCVNFSVNCNSFCQIQLWLCWLHEPQMYPGGTGLTPSFIFALVRAYEVLGPCHWRWALQHCACAGLMGAHPSVIMFWSLDLDNSCWPLIELCVLHVCMCMYTKATKWVFCIYSTASSHHVLPLCH